jgi:chorismate mutase
MENLHQLRNQIDDLDKAWMEILAQRFEVTRKVGRIKKAQTLPAIDEEREKQQFDAIQKMGHDLGLPLELPNKILRVIIDAVVEEHTQCANDIR